MASSDFTETRAVIKFCVNLGKTPTQTMEMLREANGKKSVSRSLVFKWHKRFKEGRESVKDDDGRGRHSVIDMTLVTSVKDLLDEDRRRSVREISEATGTSYGTNYTILKKHLGMNKVFARWIPKLLS